MPKNIPEMRQARVHNTKIAVAAKTGAGNAHAGRILFAHLLRGIAAGSVLSHHYLYMIWEKPKSIGELIAQPALPELVGKVSHPGIPDFGLSAFWGHFGVALFFLISGFVIPFSVSSLSPLGFAVARALRIWPTYIVGFSITLLCLLLNSRGAGITFPYTVVDVLSHYLILPRWPMLAHPIDGIIWTLEIELFSTDFVLSQAQNSRRLIFRYSWSPWQACRSVMRPAWRCRQF